jgi:CheY-like chemotaxis protein
MNECGDGRLCFRFTKYDWEKNIIHLLISNNIPYAVLQEVRMNVQQQLQKKNIFVAEDDPEILSALSALLENAGYHVRQSTGGQAIVDGNFSRVDLFILDQQMPDIGGLDVCRHLRAQSDTKDTPVIVISAHPKKGNEALSAGANDYLEKPFQIHYLLNLVSKYTR